MGTSRAKLNLNRWLSKFRRLDRISDKALREEGKDRLTADLRSITADELFEKIAALTQSGKLAAEDEAELLLFCADLPIAQGRISTIIEEVSDYWKHYLLSAIGTLEIRGLGQVLLNYLKPGVSRSCRDAAVASVGALRDPELLRELLLRAVAGLDVDKFILLSALARQPTSEMRPFFQNAWNASVSDKAARIAAAVGLAKLGDADSVCYLASMLDDPDHRTETSFQPGESIRAAQALCEVFRWPFSWGQSAVSETRNRWDQMATVRWWR
jgi:hypothetical protein